MLVGGNAIYPLEVLWNLVFLDKAERVKCKR